jgi:hypothetical protein
MRHPHPLLVGVLAAVAGQTAAADGPATAAGPAQTITVSAARGDSVYAPQPYQESQTFLPGAALQKQISIREAMDLPGVLGDPVKAIAQLPGVVSGGRGELLVHGSKEGESAPNINHLPVGYLFHLGSLHSVISPEAIDQIDVYLGNFDATYGNAIGGVVDITPRPPGGGDGGYLHLGLLDSSLGGDVALGDGWAVSFHGRRSYLDLFIPTDAFSNGDSKNRLTTFPNYWDANLTLAWTSGKHRVSLENLTAHDEFGLDLQDNEKKDPAATGPLWGRYGFSSTGLRWRYDDGVYRAMTLVGYMRQWNRFQLFSNFSLDIESDLATVFHLSTYTVGAHDLSLGFEGTYTHTPVRARSPGPPEDDQVDVDFTSSPVYDVRQDVDVPAGALIVQDTVRLGDRVRLRLGVRGEWVDFGAYRPIALPRGSLVVDVTANDSLAASAGQYARRPDGYKFADQLGNPRLTDEKADHYGLAWTHRQDGGELTIEPFYKHLYDLALSDPATGYSNSGTGRAYGIDVAAKLRGATWYLSLSYAYQDARRQLTATDRTQYSFYGDVPHTAQLSGSWQFAPAWSASFLAKYATGQPYTPIVGTYTYTDSNGSTRLRPTYGRPYSERFPDFFMLNLRAAWTTTVRTTPLELAFEVINATNQKNVQGIEYDDNYNKKGESTGLPLLVSLNATARF